MLSQVVENLLFYGFAALAVLLALLAVSSRQLLRAAIYLLGVLVVSAGFYLMLNAEFLAGVQILVYVGGIVVLLVFAIMLTQSMDQEERKPSTLRRMLGAVAAGGFFGLSVSLFWLTEFPASPGGQLGSPHAIEMGRKLLDYGPQGYVLPFEVISMLLLAAVIGGIVLARTLPAGEQPQETGQIERVSAEKGIVS